MVDSGRAHTKEYFPELLLPVSWFLFNIMVWLTFPLPEVLGELSFQDVS